MNNMYESDYNPLIMINICVMIYMKNFLVNPLIKWVKKTFLWVENFSLTSVSLADNLIQVLDPALVRHDLISKYNYVKTSTSLLFWDPSFCHFKSLCISISQIGIILVCDGFTWMFGKPCLNNFWLVSFAHACTRKKYPKKIYLYFMLPYILHHYFWLQPC